MPKSLHVAAIQEEDENEEMHHEKAQSDFIPPQVQHSVQPIAPGGNSQINIEDHLQVPRAANDKKESKGHDNEGQDKQQTGQGKMFNSLQQADEGNGQIDVDSEPHHSELHSKNKQ